VRHTCTCTYFYTYVCFRVGFFTPTYIHVFVYPRIHEHQPNARARVRATLHARARVCSVACAPPHIHAGRWVFMSQLCTCRLQRTSCLPLATPVRWNGTAGTRRSFGGRGADRFYLGRPSRSSARRGVQRSDPGGPHGCDSCGEDMARALSCQERRVHQHRQHASEGMCLFTHPLPIAPVEVWRTSTRYQATGVTARLNPCALR
jgi:hypothetical protein